MDSRAVIILGGLVAALVASVSMAAPRVSDATVRAYVERTHGPGPIRIAWSDLNSDGRAEAIVLLTGADWCGSGGCTLLVLEQATGGLRSRGKITLARTPVGVLGARTQGWRHLSVAVGGGGIPDGSAAEVPFLGGRYTGNPTVSPAHRLAAGVTPRVILP